MPPPPVSSISTHALCAVLPASRGEDQQFILFSRRQLYVNFPLFCGFRNLSNKKPAAILCPPDARLARRPSNQRRSQVPPQLHEKSFCRFARPTKVTADEQTWQSRDRGRRRQRRNIMRNSHALNRTFIDRYPSDEITMKFSKTGVTWRIPRVPLLN
jgi:hypothetical protein